jgi:hypothetical protein
MPSRLAMSSLYHNTRPRADHDIVTNLNFLSYFFFYFLFSIFFIHFLFSYNLFFSFFNDPKINSFIIFAKQFLKLKL